MIHRFSFIGGINESVDESKIKDDESPRAKNCDISDMVLKTCKGDESFCSIDDDIVSLISSCTTSRDLLMISNTKIYSYLKKGLGQDYVLKNDILDGHFDSVNFLYDNKNITILTNGYDETFYYDGTNFKSLLNRGYCTSFDTVETPVLGDNGEQLIDAFGIPVVNQEIVENHYIIGDKNEVIKEESIELTRAPKGKFIELHKERLWITGNIDIKDRLYFSSAYDINDWTYPSAPEEANEHGGFIDIPSFDGGSIIGLKAVFDDLLVFKNKSIFRIFGSHPNDFEIERLFSANGGIADKSIVVFENGCYFVAEDGLYFFNGSQVQNITPKIKNTWNRINKDTINKATATKNGSKYVLAVPTENSIFNNFIIEYDTLTDTFMFKENEYNITHLTEFNGNILYANASKEITLYNKSTCDSDLIYETKYYDLEAPQARKEIEYVYFTASGTGDIQITLETERKPKTKTVTLTDTLKPYRVKLKNKGRLMKLKIENVNKSNFVLKELFVSLELDYD